MATLSMPVGGGIGDINIHAEDLKELLMVNQELNEISRRIKDDNHFIQVREVEGNQFFEVVVYMGNGHFKRKRLGEYKPKTMKNVAVNFYLGATTPWEIWNKEENVNYIMFDYVNDELIEAGFTEVNHWYKAKSVKGKWQPL